MDRIIGVLVMGMTDIDLQIRMKENLEVPGTAFCVAHRQTCVQFSSAQCNRVCETELMVPRRARFAIDDTFRESKIKLHGCITAVAR